MSSQEGDGPGNEVISDFDEMKTSLYDRPSEYRSMRESEHVSALTPVISSSGRQGPDRVNRANYGLWQKHNVWNSRGVGSQIKRNPGRSTAVGVHAFNFNRQNV